jgi:YHS domain-containing protein
LDDVLELTPMTNRYGIGGKAERMSTGRRNLASKKNVRFSVRVFLIVMALGSLALAAILRNSTSVEAGQGPINDRSRICMLQDTIQSRSGLGYVYQGKTYYLCCGGCLAGFKSEPALHSHARDPVDGKSVDKADAPAYGYKGRAYFFDSVADLDRFAARPETFVANSSSQTVAR